jgi:hypothetical protein
MQLEDKHRSRSSREANFKSKGRIKFECPEESTKNEVAWKDPSPADVIIGGQPCLPLVLGVRLHAEKHFASDISIYDGRSFRWRKVIKLRRDTG